MLHHDFLVLARLRDVLAYYGIRAEPKCYADDKAYRYLADNFVDALQTVLVLAENLDIVVHKAEEAQPDGRDNHQQQVDVAHAA